jgi:hypothetical protein
MAKNPFGGCLRITEDPTKGNATMRKQSGLILSLALALSACGGAPSLDDPVVSQRDLDIETFFDGHLVAQGQFQDVFGKVRRQFVVDIQGDWDGERLRLVENFVYEDGSKEQRIWTLKKTGPESWEGTAPGVIGKAIGVEQGDRFNWRYTIDLPVPSAEGAQPPVRVTFDDWIWLMEDGRAFNRAYMSRYGLRAGDVSIWFEKR